MLSVEANERLTRVGPGMPCGNFLRRYWFPLRPYAQLLSETVMKVRLLGEDLVLFRTREGELGLIGDKCAYRSAGMEYGIQDREGLRCAYHGWLYSPSGHLPASGHVPGAVRGDSVGGVGPPDGRVRPITALRGSPTTSRRKRAPLA